MSDIEKSLNEIAELANLGQREYKFILHVFKRIVWNEEFTKEDVSEAQELQELNAELETENDYIIDVVSGMILTNQQLAIQEIKMSLKIREEKGK